MADINITFINQSSDSNNSQVVIFQQNVPSSFDETAVAWRVIHGVETGYRETFPFPGPVLGADLQQGVQPGQVIHSAHLSETAASFSLDGVSSADLVLSGGGGEPHTFTLQNVRPG